MVLDSVASDSLKSPLRFMEEVKVNSLPANIGERCVVLVVSQIWKFLLLQCQTDTVKPFLLVNVMA